MPEVTIQDYQAYDNRIRFLMYFGCFFRHPKLPRLAYVFIVIPMLTLNILLCAGAINFLFHNLQDIQKFCAAMTIICSWITAFTKVWCIGSKQSALKKLDQTLKYMFDIELKDESRRSSLLYLLPRFRKLATTHSCMTGITGVLFNALPLVIIYKQFKHNVQPKRCPLSIPGKFPWTINGCGMLYAVHNIASVISGCFFVFMNINSEVTFGYFSFHIAGIFRTLRDRLENPEPNENRFLLLRSCAKKHKVLLDCCSILEKSYGPTICVILLSNSVAMCCLVFQTFQSKMTVEKVMMLVVYFSVKLLQTSMYTWGATVIRTESESFSDGVYFSDWTDKSIRIKNDIVITMMQKPVVLNAMGLFVVSMDLIPKVVNTTLSYYFLLKTLDGN